MTEKKEHGAIHGSDSHEHWDNYDLFHHHLFHDFRNRNHIAMERLVPELLGEFDNAWDIQQQLAYVLACLRRLARDLNILNHEFDSVIDGLLQVINQILNEFSQEITDEINKIWNEINNLFDRDVIIKTDESLTFSKTGNWQNKDEAITFDGKIHYSTITKEVPIAGMATKTVGNASSNISGNFTPDLTGYIAELQSQITQLKNFANALIKNLNESGAYTGSSVTSQGSFNLHIAYGNINAYGVTQDGANGIFTSKVSPDDSIAVGES